MIRFASSAELRERAARWGEGDPARPYHPLFGTPDSEALAAALAEAQSAARGFVTGSGYQAICLILLAEMKPGERLLLPEGVYGPVRAFADQALGPMGIEIGTYVPSIAAAKLQTAFAGRPGLLWIEPPGSLTFPLPDAPALAQAAKQAGARVAVDNSWAGPLAHQPFAYGADYVAMALGKQVAGIDGMLLGCALSAREELHRKLLQAVALWGYGADPAPCRTALEGFRTLGQRQARQMDSALAVARFLEGRDEVAAIHFPPLPSDPGHGLWQRDFTGGAPLLSVRFRDKDRPARIADRLRHFAIALSWGGPTSLARPVEAGGETLLRLSVGLEPVEILIADLERALEETG